MDIKKQTKTNKGFTLLEMVVTLLVATIITGLFFILVNFAKDTYVEMQELSQGQILGSNLTNAIQDELRYATVVTWEPDTVKTDSVTGTTYEFTYYSQSLGKGAKCKIVSTKDTDNGGTKKRLYIRFGPTGEGKYELYSLIGNDSYIFNLEANVDCRYNPERKKFYVTISVYDSVSNAEIIKSVFMVEPLNKNSV